MYGDLDERIRYAQQRYEAWLHEEGYPALTYRDLELLWREEDIVHSNRVRGRQLKLETLLGLATPFFADEIRREFDVTRAQHHDRPQDPTAALRFLALGFALHAINTQSRCELFRQKKGFDVDALRTEIDRLSALVSVDGLVQFQARLLTLQRLQGIELGFYDAAINCFEVPNIFKSHVEQMVSYMAKTVEGEKQGREILLGGSSKPPEAPAKDIATQLKEAEAGPKARVVPAPDVKEERADALLETLNTLAAVTDRLAVYLEKADARLCPRCADLDRR